MQSQQSQMGTLQQQLDQQSRATADLQRQLDRPPTVVPVPTAYTTHILMRIRIPTPTRCISVAVPISMDPAGAIGIGGIGDDVSFLCSLRQNQGSRLFVFCHLG